jgi:RNA polymerase sigma-70 factor (ECF subfamily)
MERPPRKPRLSTITAQRKVCGRLSVNRRRRLSKFISAIVSKRAKHYYLRVEAGAGGRKDRAGSGPVGLRGDLNRIAPRLRRYARALVCGHPGPSEAADALVAAALLQVLKDDASRSTADPETEAYAAFINLHRERISADEFGGAPAHGANALVKTGSFAGGGRPPERLRNVPLQRHDPLASALLSLKLEEREVLLLVVLEGFNYARAARALKISRAILIARLARARERLPKILGSPSERPKPRPPHLRLVK